MAELDLSNEILDLSIDLIREADFVRIVEATDPGFDVGDSLRLVFDGGTTWPAVVDAVASTATWNVDKVEVNALIDTQPQVARLYYKSGDLDLLWAKGKPRING